MKDCIASHTCSILRDKFVQLPLARHFIEKGNTISQLKFLVIDGVDQNRCGGNPKQVLRKKEVQWIHSLDTLQPRGLNSDMDLYLFM